MQQYRFEATGPIKATTCAQNNRYFNQGLFSAPKADEPDFRSERTSQASA
jgi:hypothetical protein